MDKSHKLIAIFTNHDDDVYCFRKELIEKLIHEGYRVLISCPYGEKLTLMKDIDFEFVDTKIDRRGTNILCDLKLIYRYFRILYKYRPSIVLTYTIKPNIYVSLIASLFKIPYINNITGLGSIDKKSGLIKKFIIILLKMGLKKSNCVFFQNRENMDFAKSLNLIKGKYGLIPGSGVNTDRFALIPYPSDSNIIIFNYIGRVLKDKGIDDYIEAATRIKAKYVNTEFNIIGFIEPTESHYIDKLKDLEDKGILIYRGNQLDVRSFIARSHCTIHPSTYGEGMSNVLLESASSGRPVITTNIAGCREIVDNNISGLIYHAGDVNDLEYKIEKFLAMDINTRQKMGLLGRKKVEKEFTRQIVIDAYLSEIRKAI